MIDNNETYLEDVNIWSETTASRYDTPGEGMFAEDIVQPAISFLKELAGDGNALEFAVGTGRIAIPLLESGVSVSGIDYAKPMVDVLYKKINPDHLPVVIGDMATAKVEGVFSLVYLVYNGLSNLLTQEAQIECFMNAAHHLSKKGRFVIELWIPELRKLPPGQKAVVFETQAGSIGLDVYDLDRQHVISHHFQFDEKGNNVELFRSKHRYVWPSELDLMARLAGFKLENRYSDWHKKDYDVELRSHISVYVKE